MAVETVGFPAFPARKVPTHASGVPVPGTCAAGELNAKVEQRESAFHGSLTSKSMICLDYPLPGAVNIFAAADGRGGTQQMPTCRCARTRGGSDEIVLADDARGLGTEGARQGPHVRRPRLARRYTGKKTCKICKIL